MYASWPEKSKHISFSHFQHNGAFGTATFETAQESAAIAFMLGRKAILHTAKAGSKRKWQLEQERGSDDDSESSESERPTFRTSEAGGARPANLAEPTKTDSPQGVPARRRVENDSSIAEQTKGEQPNELPVAHSESQAHELQGEGSSDEGVDGEKGKAQKRFAWMDSDDDEVSDGEEVEARHEQGSDAAAEVDEHHSPKQAETNGSSAQVSTPARVAKPGAQTLVSAAVAAAISAATPLLPGGRPGLTRLRTPAVLPPGTRLPVLTKKHLALMAQIGTLRTLDDLWELVDRNVDDFGAAHAATTLHRISVLAAAPAVGMPSTSAVVSNSGSKLEKHFMFMRICDRLDELLATAEGRATFLSADLSMIASALAKVLQVPVKEEGAISRLLAELADEAEIRVSSDPSAFTAPMLADIVWGATKTGRADKRLLRTIIGAASNLLSEMTCQDLANFAEAYADETMDECDDLLRGIFSEAKVRLHHQSVSSAAQSGGASGMPVPLPGALGPRPPPPVPLQPMHMRPAQQSATNPQQSAVAPGAGAADASTQAATASQKPNRDDSQSSSVQRTAEPPLWQQTGQWRFTGAHVTEITSSMAKHLPLYDEAVFAMIAAQYAQRLQEFTVPQLQRLRDAFEVVRYESDFEFLVALRAALKTRERRPVWEPRPPRTPYGR